MWMAAAIVLLSQVMLSSHPQPPARDLPAPRQSATATLRGRVVAADSGGPLRHARVALAGSSNIPPVFTANDGRFAFTGLPAGRYTISARKAGYAPTTFGQTRPDVPPIPIDLEAGDVFQEAELRMPPSAAIAGRITDEYGDPIELATVVASRIVRRDTFTIGMVAATAVTDDLGEYRLGALSAGSYIVTATTARRAMAGPSQTRAYYPGVAGRVQAQPIVVRAGEERSATDFTVAPGRLAKLTIAFTDLKGEPANAVAMIANTSQYLGDAQAPIVPIVGSVVTPSLEPGDWSIFARSPEGGVGIARVSLGSDDAAITMPLVKGGRVTGRIVSESGSIPRDTPFMVDAFTDLPPPAGLVVPSSARVYGSAPFELTELLGPRQLRARPAVAAGWFVTAVLHDGRNLLDENIDFKGGETLSGVQVVVSDRGGSVNGSAVGAEGAPLADYFVLVFPEETGSLARLRRLARAGRSNQKGVFAIEHLPPGRYLGVALDEADNATPPTSEYVDRLRARATPFTIAERQTTTVILKLAQ